MKKLSALMILLAAGMIFVTGCGNNTEDDNRENASKKAVEESIVIIRKRESLPRLSEKAM